ncbi:MAG: hypothetical protein U0228_07810 [Myxococcaceae bacterium]
MVLRGVLVWLGCALASSCAADQAPLLALDVAPAAFDPATRAVRATVRAFDAHGQPGRGVVVVEPNVGTVELASATLDADGTASFDWACPTLACGAGGTLTARWDVNGQTLHDSERVPFVRDSSLQEEEPPPAEPCEALLGSEAYPLGLVTLHVTTAYGEDDVVATAGAGAFSATDFVLSTGATGDIPAWMTTDPELRFWGREPYEVNRTYVGTNGEFVGVPHFDVEVGQAPCFPWSGEGAVRVTRQSSVTSLAGGYVFTCSAPFRYSVRGCFSL